MSTYLQLVNIVRRECAVSGGSIPSVLNQTGLFEKLVEWTADADYEIQALHTDWNFLWSQWEESTIASTATYSKPSDLSAWDMESFYLDYSTSSNRKLESMTYKDWRSSVRNGIQVTGKPSHFIVKPDNNLVFYRTPDAVYSVTADYWKSPVRMSANSSTPLIPARFERAIIALAKMKYAEDQGVPVILSNSEIEFTEWVTRLEADQLPGQSARNLIESPIEDSSIVIV